MGNTNSEPVSKTIMGQKSWPLRSRAGASAWVTHTGGHVGPITFDLGGGRTVSPYSVAPWATETLDPATPPILRVLRGDFFCMPFGGNQAAYRGERHPIHGQTANARWKFRSCEREGDRTTIALSMNTTIRPGHVEKAITVRDGEPAIYQRHTITGMKGKMSLGHHTMLQFPDAENSGLISTSPMIHRQVFVEPVERPEDRGYSALVPGAIFDNLSSVPDVFGGRADLSRYPARRGYEDIVIQINDPSLPLAWTAVSFPRERYAWIALKNPAVLTATLFWISNGGRHYAPWNGRHVNVMGLEEVTSAFHVGLASSAKPSTLSALGVKTAHDLRANVPLEVRYTMACCTIPAGFDHVERVEVESKGLTLISRSGKRAKTNVDGGFALG